MKNKYKILGNVAIIYIVRRNGEECATVVDTEDIQKLVDSRSSWYINEYAQGKLRVQGRAHVGGAQLKPACIGLY